MDSSNRNNSNAPERAGHSACVSLMRDTLGVVQVEFLLAFLPIFMLFLACLQMGMLYTGELMVQHSANAAVRAAAVILPDDPAHYSGARVFESGAGRGGRDGGELDGIGRFASGNAVRRSAGGSRLAAARSAAGLALVGLAPSLDGLSEQNRVERAVGGLMDERLNAGAIRFVESSVALNFPVAPGSQQFRQRFGPNDLLTARVSFLMHCGVPIVSRLMCSKPSELRAGSAQALERLRETNAVRTLRERRASEQGGSMGELASTFRPPQGGALENHRFYLLRSEAQFPMQGARYDY